MILAYWSWFWSGTEFTNCRIPRNRDRSHFNLSFSFVKRLTVACRVFSLFFARLRSWEGGNGLFWRGACLLRGVSSLPAIKRKLRVNPTSLPRLITIYPHPDLEVKSQKKVWLKIIVIFFQTRFNFNFAPPTSSLSACKLLSLLAEILTRLQL